MKKTLAFILFAGLFAGFKCVKNSPAPVGSTHRGIVLRSICCQDVIRLIDGDTLGQDNWIDSGQTPAVVYHDVFRVANPCQFGTHADGDTITFRVLSSAPAQTCACCMLFAYTPQTGYPIQVQ